VSRNAAAYNCDAHVLRVEGFRVLSAGRVHFERGDVVGTTVDLDPHTVSQSDDRSKGAEQTM
jgi:hypothetical protein